jgi:hypothetical protein
MKRHLSPHRPHKTDLPSGSARPLAVRRNSLTSDRCSVCWQELMRRLSTPSGPVILRRSRQCCVEVGAALRTEVQIPRDSGVVILVQAAVWTTQCVTDQRAEGDEYAEDHAEHRHLERTVMLNVDIGECPEAESARESEQDEGASGAQEFLAGRRRLHVREHYGPQGRARARPLRGRGVSQRWRAFMQPSSRQRSSGHAVRSPGLSRAPTVRP